MSDIKIQINSAEALDRLIGEDPQLKIEIKNAIIQDFGKKYVKALMDQEIQSIITKGIKDVLEGLESPIDKYVYKTIENCWTVLRPTQILQNMVKDSLDGYIGQIVKETCEQAKAEVMEAVEIRMREIKSAAIAQISDESIKNSIECGVRARIEKIYQASQISESMK